MRHQPLFCSYFKFLSWAALGAIILMGCRVPTVFAQTAADSSAPSLTLSLSYTGDFLRNVSGGERRGSTLSGAAGADLTMRLGRLIGWHGARIFLSALDTR